MRDWRRNPLDPGVTLNSADEERDVSVLRGQSFEQGKLVRVATDHLSMADGDVHAPAIRASEQFFSPGLEELGVRPQAGERSRIAFAGPTRAERRGAGGRYSGTCTHDCSLSHRASAVNEFLGQAARCRHFVLRQSPGSRRFALRQSSIPCPRSSMASVGLAVAPARSIPIAGDRAREAGCQEAKRRGRGFQDSRGPVAEPDTSDCRLKGEEGPRVQEAIAAEPRVTSGSTGVRRRRPRSFA